MPFNSWLKSYINIPSFTIVHESWFKWVLRKLIFMFMSILLKCVYSKWAAFFLCWCAFILEYLISMPLRIGRARKQELNDPSFFNASTLVMMELLVYSIVQFYFSLISHVRPAEDVAGWNPMYVVDKTFTWSTGVMKELTNAFSQVRLDCLVVKWASPP